MPSIKIDKDEWYPVFCISTHYGVEVEVPQDLIERWDKAEQEFDAVQAIVGKLYDTANGGPK